MTIFFVVSTIILGVIGSLIATYITRFIDKKNAQK